MDNVAGTNPLWAVSRECRAAAEAFLRTAVLCPLGNGAGSLTMSRDGLYLSLTIDPSGKIIGTTAGSK